MVMGSKRIISFHEKISAMKQATQPAKYAHSNHGENNENVAPDNTKTSHKVGMKYFMEQEVSGQVFTK